MSSHHPEDLLQRRLEAVWREEPATLKAWATSVAAAKEVQLLLHERGWDARDRIKAADQLAKAVLSVAPGGRGAEL